ncbi:MAG TPA: hypothetical protein DCW90_03455 [Lachnospiraceae bacterium]|nr:hypothetical protein [Lachnospiraceae bacterium]
MSSLKFVFSNLIWYYAALSLLGHFLGVTNEKKYPKKSFWYTGSFFFAVGLTIALIPLSFGWYAILYIIMCGVYANVFFKNRGNKNVMGALGFGVISTLIQYVFENIAKYWVIESSLISDWDEEYTYPIVSTCAVVFLCIIYRIVITAYCICHDIRPELLGTVNFVIIVLYSILSLLLVFKLREHPHFYMENEMLILILLIGLVVINAFALSYGSNTTQNSILRYKLKKEEEKNKITYDYYKNMEKNYSNCRKVLHDVKNHVQVMDALYASGQLENATEYAGTLAKEIDNIYPECYSTHKILNIILHDKKKKAEEYQIDMEFEVEDVTLDFLSDYHLSTILCNLFDNAIIACTKLPEEKRRITFKIRTINSFLVMKMENPIDPERVKEMEPKNIIHRMRFGTGLENVNNVVTANKGEISTDISDEMFCISITFAL